MTTNVIANTNPNAGKPLIMIQMIVLFAVVQVFGSGEKDHSRVGQKGPVEADKKDHFQSASCLP